MARHAKRDEGYDWLNDPFDDKKNEEDQMSSAKMSGASKTALCIGCLAIAVIVVAIVVVSCSSIASLMGQTY